MENGNQRIHFERDTRQKAIGILIAQEGQVDVAEALGTFQSVISRVLKRYYMTGIPDEQHPGSQYLTTLAHDRYLVQQARREPTVTAPILHFASYKHTGFLFMLKQSGTFFMKQIYDFIVLSDSQHSIKHTVGTAWGFPWPQFPVRMSQNNG